MRTLIELLNNRFPSVISTIIIDFLEKDLDDSIDQVIDRRLLYWLEEKIKREGIWCIKNLSHWLLNTVTNYGWRSNMYTFFFALSRIRYKYMLNLLKRFKDHIKKHGSIVLRMEFYEFFGRNYYDVCFTYTSDIKGYKISHERRKLEIFICDAFESYESEYCEQSGFEGNFVYSLFAYIDAEGRILRFDGVIAPIDEIEQLLKSSVRALKD